MLPKEAEGISLDWAAECLSVGEWYRDVPLMPPNFAGVSWQRGMSQACGSNEASRPGPFGVAESLLSSYFCLSASLISWQKRRVSDLVWKESIALGCSLSAGFLMTLLSQFHQASLVLSENISLDLGKNEPMWVPATTRLRLKKHHGGVACSVGV